jgi:RecB family exonuclease
MSQIYELHMHTWEELQALFLKKETVVNLAGELICSRDRKCESKADLDTAWLIYVHDIQRAFCAGKPVPEIVLQAFQTWKAGQSITRPEQKAQEPEMKPKKAFKFSWSPSAISDFENCAFAYAQKRVYKTIPYQQSEQMIHGERLHKALEKIVLGQDLYDSEKKLIEPHRKFADAIKNAAEQKNALIIAEKSGGELALNRALKPCDWFAADAWGRCIIDVAVLNQEKVTIIDWKSGKKKQDQTQLEVMMCFAALHYPNMQEFQAKFVWLKSGEAEGTPVIQRKELLPILQKILSRVKRMEQAVEADVFQKIKNGLCGAWCPCTQCEHNGRRCDP